VAIDTLVDVTSAIDPTFKDRSTVAKVCDRIDGLKVGAYDTMLRDAAKPHGDVLRAMHYLYLRARYAMTDGPFLLHVEEPLTYDELEQYLQSIPDVLKQLRRKGRI
jgi:hypothetical protein